MPPLIRRLRHAWIFCLLLGSGCTPWGYMQSGIPVADMGGAGQVNFEEASCLVTLSVLAYKSTADIEAYAGAGYTVRHIVDNQKTFDEGWFKAAFYLTPKPQGTRPRGCPDAPILVVPGTEASKWRDWRTNLSGDPIPVEGIEGKLHTGFYTSALKLREVLGTDLNTSRLYLAGHSKGGAIAVALYLILVKETQAPQNFMVYTIGQPKLRVPPHPDSSPIDGSRIVRFIHFQDPVPMVPPALNDDPPLAFRHFSPAIYLWGDDTWSYISTDKVRRQWGGDTLAFGDFDDHTRTQYQSLVEHIARDCGTPGSGYGGKCLVAFDRKRFANQRMERLKTNHPEPDGE